MLRKAKLGKRAVTVEPVDGDFAVIVDGVIWCYAFRKPRGMHGNSYTLRYTRSHVPFKEAEGRGQKPREVVIWSNKALAQLARVLRTPRIGDVQGQAGWQVPHAPGSDR